MLPILLAVLLGFVEKAGSQMAVNKYIWPDPLEGSDALLTKIIEISPLPYCSYIVVTDGDLNLNHIFHKDMQQKENSWGLATYELKRMNGNETLEVIRTTTKARKLSWNTVVILMSTDIDFLSMAGNHFSKARLLVWSTRLIVVTSIPVKNINSLLGQQWTFTMMNTILLNSEVKDRTNGWSIYANIPYSKKLPHVKRIAFWNKRSNLYLFDDPQLFREKFSSFNGSKVNITALPFPPFWISRRKRNSDGSTSETATGTDRILLETIAQALNFTINHLPAKDWNEVTQLVTDRVSFMATVVHSVLPQRMDHYDYSYPYEFHSLTFSAAKMAIIPQWQALYYPLTDIVWGAILFTLFLALGFFKIVNTSGAHFGNEKKMETTSIVLVVLRTLFSQSLSVKYPSMNSFRVILCFWLLFVFIVSTAYRANLTASLTLPKYPPRPETVEELVRAVYTVTMPSYGRQHRDFFKQSQSPVFRSLGENMILGPTMQEGLQRALKSREAFMEGRRYLEHNIVQHFTDADGRTSLYIGRQNVIPGMGAWPIPHDAPFKPQIDAVMMAVIEAGLYEKWSRDTMHESRLESIQKHKERNNEGLKEAEALTEESDQKSGSLMTLNLIHMQGPFMILLLGFVLSALLFIYERLIVYK